MIGVLCCCLLKYYKLAHRCILDTTQCLYPHHTAKGALQRTVCVLASLSTHPSRASWDHSFITWTRLRQHTMLRHHAHADAIRTLRFARRMSSPN